MQYLKRILLGLLISLLLCMATGLAIVYFYGDDVKNYLVKEINKQLNTEVHVKEIKFSVFDEFPLAALEFIDVTAKDAYRDKLKNTGVLFNAKSIFLAFNMVDVFNKKYTIKKVIISEGNLRLKIDREGHDNYHFWKASSDTTSTDFKFGLKEVSIINTLLSYNNRFSRQQYDVRCNAVKLTGQFSKEQFSLDTQCDLFVHTLQSDNIKVLESKSCRLDFKIEVSDHLKNFVCEKGIVEIADLAFETKGKVVTEKGISTLDIFLNAKNMNIGSALSLFPEQFLSGIEEYKARGTGFFKSHIYGDINKTTTPRIDIDFGISDGEMVPANNLAALKNVELKGFYTNGVNHNKTSSSIEINNFSATLNNKGIKAGLRISDFSNPLIKLVAEGSANLADVSSFVKMDTLENLKGIVELKVQFDGRKKEISKESFARNRIKATGDFNLKDVGFNFKNDPLAFKNLNGTFQLEDNNLLINELMGTFSNSDFHIEGALKNIVSYIFLKDQKLSIEGALVSRNLNLDDWIRPDDAGKSAIDSSQAGAFLPDLAGDITIMVGQLKYKKFESFNIKGKVSFKDEILHADHLTFSTMDGLINLEGSMDASKKDSILIACKVSIKQLNVASMFYQLGNFGQEVIKDKHIKGYITSDVEFASVWSRSLKVNPDKIYARGKIKIENGELVDFKPLLALSKFVKLNELKRIKFSTLQNDILIKNQKISIPSMEIKSNALNLKVEGIHSFDNRIDYKLTLLLSDILGKKVKDQQTEFGVVEEDGMGQTKLFITMKGDLSNPKFAYDKASVKQKIKSDFKNEKQTLKNILKEEFGWFKKDSVKVKPDLNTPKSGIQIDRDEDSPANAEGKKDAKPSSKSPPKKSAFERFKESVSSPDEE